MANRYSIASGLASDINTWDGGLGVPVSGDRVMISRGHTVELDGNYEWGDDSTATVTYNGAGTLSSIAVWGGVLKASRTVSSSLTCNGGLRITTLSGANRGEYDAGTALDPIPLGVNHTLILNKSASMAVGKYGYISSGTSSIPFKLSLHGHYRRRNTVLLGAVAIAATSAVVEDATGWQVGDSLVFAPTTTYNSVDNRTILTITAGSGTTATVTFAALTYAHMNDAPVGNLSSNVVIAPFNQVYGSYFNVSATNSSGYYPSYIHIENVRFEGTGATAYGASGALGLFATGYTPALGVAIDPIRSCVFTSQNGVTNGSAILLGGQRQKVLLSDNAFFFLTVNTTCISLQNTTPTALLGSDDKYNVVYRLGQASAGYMMLNSSLAIVSGSFKAKIFGSFSYAINLNMSSDFVLDAPIFGPVGSSYLISANSSSNTKIIDGDFGYTFGRGGAYAALNTTTGGVLSITFVRPKFASGPFTATSNANNTNAGSFVHTAATLGDLANQSIYMPEGNLVRDNSVFNRSTSAIRFDLFTSGISPLTYSTAFFAPNGVPQTIVGYIRKNTTYGADTQPSVTVSGLGITPVTYTLSGPADTWEKFALVATNTSGSDGDLTLTFSGQSITSTAQCWFDGMVSSPFVTSARHFGYEFDASLTRTLDSRISLPEAAALALPVVVDHTGQTITITGTLTNAEVFHACMADLCQTANLTKAVHITSTDGADFTTAYTVIGTVTGLYTGVAGRHVAINAPNLIAQTRVQLYNVTDGVELYNSELVSQGASVPATWLSDKTIRLRAGYAQGAVAKQAIESFGVLTSSGLTFIDTQVPDAVYNALAIDGGTCTEFTPDFPNLQIDLSDGDGTTSVQRLYAWAAWSQTSAQGIALMFRGVQARDTANYVIDVAVVNAKLDNITGTPIIISGGYLSRSDGTTVIAATSGSIQMDPGKAYIAAGQSVSDIATAVWNYTQ